MLGDLLKSLLLNLLQLDSRLLVHLLDLTMVQELLIYFEAERVLQQRARLGAARIHGRVLRLELLNGRLQELYVLLVLHRLQGVGESVLDEVLNARPLQLLSNLSLTLVMHALRYALDSWLGQAAQLLLLERCIVKRLRLATLYRSLTLVLHLGQLELANLCQVAVVVGPHLGRHILILWLVHLGDVRVREPGRRLFLSAISLLFVLGKVRRPAHLLESLHLLRFGL